MNQQQQSAFEHRESEKSLAIVKTFLREFPYTALLWTVSTYEMLTADKALLTESRRRAYITALTRAQARLTALLGKLESER